MLSPITDDDLKKTQSTNKTAVILSLVVFVFISLASGLTIFLLQQKNAQDNKLLAWHYTTPLSGIVLGATTAGNWQVKPAAYSKDLDTDQDGLTNEMENLLGTDPENPDTDKDGKKDGAEMTAGDDPTSLSRIKATITLPKIKVSAPVIWSVSNEETRLQKDLQNGVIHYPGTAMPGQTGNSFITGHSSDYSWTPGNYKKIFSTLQKLEKNDLVKFDYDFHNGRRITYEYKIIAKEIVMPDDSRLFAQTNKKILTLVTCWPLNSSWKRLMLKGELME